MKNSRLDEKIEKDLIELQSLSLDNEASVTGKFLTPLLKLLGYQPNDIKMQYPLIYPFKHEGTTKTKPKHPDYMLLVDGQKKWVLDAKHPSEFVSSKTINKSVCKHINQVQSYAAHTEIQVELFALCNGNKFALYKTQNTDYQPVFEFERSELLDKWHEIFNLLSFKSFQENKNDLTIRFQQIIPQFYNIQQKQELIKWILSSITGTYNLKFINTKNNRNIYINDTYADFFVENIEKSTGLIRYIYNKSLINKDDMWELTSQFVEKEISYIYFVTNIAIDSEAYEYITNHQNKRKNEPVEILGCEQLPKILMENQKFHIPEYKEKCKGNVENITLLATEKKELYWAVEEEINQKGEPDHVLIFSPKNNLINIEFLRSSLSQNKLFVGCSIENGHENINEYINNDYQTSSSRELLESEQTIHSEIPIPHIPIAESFESDSACDPQDFIGREKIKQEFWNFINDVENKNTAKRIFTIEGKSGYGKSSLILKLEQESQNKDNIFFYQIDIRLLCQYSQEPFIVRSAIKKAIQESINQGFTDLPNHIISISRERSLFYDHQSIRKVRDYLKKNNKIIIICFDQFDHLFTRNELLDIYKAFASIVIEVNSLKENFILGFSCRKGIPLTEDSVREKWNELKDIRQVFEEIQEFNNIELEEYLNKFSQLLSKDKNIKIRDEQKEWLKANCAGFPYLLRQVCSSIYKYGDSLSITNKKVEELMKEIFEQDLNQLNMKQQSILIKIAKEENIEESDEKELTILEEKRFLKRSDGKYIIHEIRKDYYVDKKLPEIPTNYIPRMNVNGSLYAMRNINKYKTKREFMQFLIYELTYKEDTADNFWIDIQNIFYVVHNLQNDQITFPEEFHNSTKSNLEDYQIADYLPSYFQRHLIVKELLKKDCLENIESFDRDTYKQVYYDIIVNRNQGTVNRTKESINDDASRLLTWLCFAGIFEFIKPIKRYRVPKKIGSAKNKGKILECGLKIQKQDKIANNLDNPEQLTLF